MGDASKAIGALCGERQDWVTLIRIACVASEAGEPSDPVEGMGGTGEFEVDAATDRICAVRPARVCPDKLNAISLRLWSLVGICCSVVVVVVWPPLQPPRKDRTVATWQGFPLRCLDMRAVQLSLWPVDYPLIPSIPSPGLLASLASGEAFLLCGLISKLTSRGRHRCSTDRKTKYSAHPPFR